VWRGPSYQDCARAEGSKTLPASRYLFDAIFNWDGTNLVPKYAIALNGTARFQPGQPIPRDASAGGLVLFNYIGRDIIGTWNDETSVLQIEGFG